MRIESVEAQAFGPFHDRRLEIAPGLTVVAGPNESGKSSWHAALYAAVCGVRRGGGQPRKEDREFAERHHPWDGDRWEVSALVRLEDGRRVHLHHDLAGRVDCSATDADLGRNYSAQIMDDGAPNAAKWLGLDRRAFQSTACVRQAQIQEVLNEADALQEHLQRAAATAGSDATAAAALAALAAYGKDHVGLERSNSTKPLQSAVVALTDAHARLSRAREAHDDYLRRIERVEQLTAEAEQASTARRLFDAKQANLRAANVRAQLARARELSTAHPQEPPAAVDDGAVSDQAAAALDAWRRRPQPEQLTGTTAGELQAQLERLPAAPTAETAPWPSVVTAKESLERARNVLDAHRQQEPREPAAIDAGGLSPGDLRRLADGLSVADPAPDPAIDERIAAAGRELESAKRSALWPRLVLAGAALTAVLAFAGGAAGPGAIALVIAAGAGVQAWRGRSNRVSAAALQELHQAEADAATARAATALAIAHRQAARDEALEHGLAPDAGGVRELAVRLDEAERLREDGERWHARLAQLQSAVGVAEDALATALSDRGAQPGDDLSAILARYQEACADRQAQSAEAARRPQLEAALADRQRLEEAYRRRETDLAEAGARLAAAARVAGVGGADELEIVAGLEDWRSRRDDAIRAGEDARKEWYELQTLLDGRALADLEGEAREIEVRADELARGLSSDAIEAIAVTGDADAQGAALREMEQVAAGALASERGALSDFERSVPSVSEAEEEEARCREELERVRGVGRVLAVAEVFLKQSQDSVHRDLAPVLRQTLRQWLPRITSGRYDDAIVDPASLIVSVQAPGRPLRKANLLSHGTAEQVYLLLRMALATHLTTVPREVCPLILDDVTVQCDAVRRRAVLEVLHETSADRQIVLFSQEAEVLVWARANLCPPRDSVVELDSSIVPA